MAMSIQTNMGSISALKSMNTNSLNMNKSLERLSSGFRINSAADDAAGYAISAKLQGEKGKLEAASQNALQATSMVKTADAGINEIENMVRRLQVLATQAASANNSGDIAKLNNEASTLTTQIDKLADSTKYNGVNLLNGIDSSSALAAGTGMTNPNAAGLVANDGAGTITLGVVAAGAALGTDGADATLTYTFTAAATGTVTSDIDLIDNTTGATIAAGTDLTAAQLGVATLVWAGGTADDVGTASIAAANGGTARSAGNSDYSGSLSFQVGAENNTDNQVAVDFQNKFTTAGLGITGDVASAANAKLFITELSTALDTLTTNRASLGASVNQLSYVSANLATNIEQMSSAISTIKDADMAAEMADFTKSQVMVQAGTAMLAQANQSSQNVLSLFR